MITEMNKHDLEEYLSLPLVGRLATSRNNVPHVVPVWFEFDGDYVWIPTPANSRKVRNIKRNRRVALVVDTYNEDWTRYNRVLITGEADLLEDSRDLSRTMRIFRRYFSEKIADKTSKSLLTSERLIVRVKPLRVIAVKEEL